MGNKQPNGPARFPSAESVGPRDWGTETLLCQSSGNYTLKLITMKEGAKGGLQYHHKKDEAGYMLYGMVVIRYDPGEGKLAERIVTKGDTFHFPTGSVHQAIALTDCAYIEASTPHFNDRCHVEHEYGFAEESGGLPSTTPEQVETR